MKKLLLIALFAITTQIQPMQRTKEFAKKTTVTLTAGLIGLEVGNYYSPIQRSLRQGDQAAQAFYEKRNNFYKTREASYKVRDLFNTEYNTTKAEYDKIIRNKSASNSTK